MTLTGRDAPAPLLVLRALGLGDLLTAVPALRALARAFPERRRVLAMPQALAPLVELIGTDPRRAPYGGDRAIDAIVPLPAAVAGRAPAPDTAAQLPRGALAVNLHGRGPESHRLLLAAAPAYLIAFRHRDVLQTVGSPPWEPGEHEVARWCRLLCAHGIAADPAALDLMLSGSTRDRSGPTLIHPGAASAARRWPPARWAAVARGEVARGRAVLVTGSEAEAPLAVRIAAAADLPADAVRAGRTDLRGLVALVAGAGRVACADTGVAHLATALRVPSVILFGPTSPAAWGPPPERPWHRALWCGRIGDPHASSPDRGLLELTPADVLAALADLPEPPAPHTATSPRPRYALSTS
ncbi:MAG TPA: glycosyltransferase family 9 protein [Conexibacter sp.]|nr:glycosyltransferase family 9 protein [Conexibacter sp.]